MRKASFTQLFFALLDFYSTISYLGKTVFHSTMQQQKNDHFMTNVSAAESLKKMDAFSTLLTLTVFLLALSSNVFPSFLEMLKILSQVLPKEYQLFLLQLQCSSRDFIAKFLHSFLFHLRHTSARSRFPIFVENRPLLPAWRGLMQ